MHGINVPGMHAEMVALRRLDQHARRHKVHWARIEMVVVRWSPERGTFAQSKPCFHCMQTLRRSRVGYVRWSDEGGELTVCRTCDLDTSHVCGGYRGGNLILGTYAKSR